MRGEFHPSKFTPATELFVVREHDEVEVERRWRMRSNHAIKDVWLGLVNNGGRICN